MGLNADLIARQNLSCLLSRTEQFRQSTANEIFSDFTSLTSTYELRLNIQHSRPLSMANTSVLHNTTTSTCRKQQHDQSRSFYTTAAYANVNTDAYVDMRVVDLDNDEYDLKRDARKAYQRLNSINRMSENP
jgi:hypothetical protein